MSKNKKPFFVAHFHKVFIPRSLTPFDLRLMFYTKWKTLQSYTPLEDSSLGSLFREVIAAIIFNIFRLVFHRILPQILSNLYESFTSDAIKLSQKNEFLTLRAFRLHSHEDT